MDEAFGHWPGVRDPRDFLVIALAAAIVLLVGAHIIYAYTSLWVCLAVSIFGVTAYGILVLRAGVIETADVRWVASRLGELLK